MDATPNTSTSQSTNMPPVDPTNTNTTPYTQTPYVPPFSYNIHSWFRHMELLWNTTPFSSEQKFNAVLRALPADVFEAISHSLPVDPSFDALKAAIIESHDMSPYQYLQALEDVKLEGRRPSVLLRHMQQLNEKAAFPFTDTVIRTRHTKLMPPTIQLHLRAQQHLNLTQYARLADSLMEMYTDTPNEHHTYKTTANITTPPPTQHTDTTTATNLHTPRPTSAQHTHTLNTLPLSQPQPTPFTTTQHTTTQPTSSFHTDIQQLTQAIHTMLQSMHTIPQTTYPQHQPRNQATQPSPHSYPSMTLPRTQMPNYCTYHLRFGQHARNCRPPCQWHPAPSHFSSRPRQGNE